jgi:maltose-binding protein MalE
MWTRSASNKFVVVAMILSSSLTTGGNAWVLLSTGTASYTATTSSSSFLNALSERQMQFWEDVEEGLDDIENFYQKKGMDIDRIRQFGKR